MRTLIENKKPIEKVVIAGLLLEKDDPALFEEDMQEMRELCSTAGVEVVAVITQRRPSIAASTYMGAGKLYEIKQLMKTEGATTLIIDAALAPGQVRNIEKIIQGKVIDRSQLILDIFALHARTNESQIQVELAQLRTIYPRLTHAWSHFGQQTGGIGTRRGPGEKQLEEDRRLVQKKISELKKKLEKIEKGRGVERKGRDNVFKAVLIGYTNVGKSSLLNALCGSDVLAEDKLFATLDTATRQAYLPSVGKIIISDTVGLIRKLPHHLVASFRSTLGIVSDADLILHVMDASNGWIDQQYKTVNEVLRDLNAEKIPRLLIFNKSDLLMDMFTRKRLSLTYPDSVFVSAFNKDDIKTLRDKIDSFADQIMKDRRKDAEIRKRIKDEFSERVLLPNEIK